MEDADGGFSFDFEGGLDTAVAGNAATPPTAALGGQVISTVAAAGVGVGASSSVVGPTPGTAQVGRRNYRQTVCRHWLRGLCMKGDLCGFLHQLDRTRMPICRFFSKYGECHEPDCSYKHTFEGMKECNMYKMGFCPNGPECRYRHVKLPGPFPPLEESLQKIQLRATAASTWPYMRHTIQRPGFNPQDAMQPLLAAPAQPQLVLGADKARISQHLPTQEENQQQQQFQLPPLPPSPVLPQMQQRTVALDQQGADTGQTQAQNVRQQAVSNGSASQAYVSQSSPLPQGFSRCFIVKSSNGENLELSVVRGLWATR